MGRRIETTKATIAEAVKNRRMELGWSQLELAETAGVDRKTVNRIENGRYSPSMNTLVSVGTALGLTMTNMLGDK